MELYIDGIYLGKVEKYWQDREEQRWNFEFEIKNGIQKVISIHFSNIKSFTSSGKLEVITDYVEKKKNLNTLFKNDLISIVENDTRLEVYDSDSRYIDYFFHYDDYENEDEVKKGIQEIITEVSKMNENELSQYLYNLFDILKIEPYCGDEETMSELREEWGDEYVVRIGNTALIIKE